MMAEISVMAQWKGGRGELRLHPEKCQRIVATSG